MAGGKQAAIHAARAALVQTKLLEVRKALAKQAVPALTKALRGADLAKDWSVGSEIARALAHIGPDAKPAAAALKHFAIGCRAHLRQVEARGPASAGDLSVNWAKTDYNAVVHALAKIGS